ncbi:MAG: PDZ domain-containing protein [Acidobacteria bacterium]|nr:PDZ domain-containing protein [Acidobacteriota bacterium]
MKRKCIAAAGAIVLMGLPLAGQRVERARRAAAPAVAEFESSGHSYLGVGVTDIGSDRVQALKLKDDRGVEITQIDQEAPAGKAGLKEHDVILTFNGTPVESMEQFKRLMRETPPGRTVSLDVMRDGQQQNFKVQLADRKKFESSVFVRPDNDFAFVAPAIPPMPAMPAMPAFPRWNEQTLIRVRSNSGATLESLSPQLGDYFGVKNGEGMLVRSVQKGSPAEQGGLRAGDVVVRVGDQKITDNSDWREALRNNKDGKVSVVVMRDRKEQTLSIAVSPRRGADSSALMQNNCPDGDAEQEVELGFLPDAELSIENALDLSGNAFNDPEVQQSIRKAMEQLHRELIDQNGKVKQNLNRSLKIASAQMKVQGEELQKAIREVSRNLEKVRVTFGDDMQ